MQHSRIRMSFPDSLSQLHDYLNQTDTLNTFNSNSLPLTFENLQKHSQTHLSTSDSGYFASQENTTRTRFQHTTFHNQPSSNRSLLAQNEAPSRVIPIGQQYKYSCSSESDPSCSFDSKNCENSSVSSQERHTDSNSYFQRYLQVIMDTSSSETKSRIKGSFRRDVFNPQDLDELLFDFYKLRDNEDIFHKIEHLLRSTEIWITRENIESAINCGESRLVKLLLDHCCIRGCPSKTNPELSTENRCIDLDSAQGNSLSLLVYAIQSRDFDIIKLIVDAGASLSIRYSNGRNILHIAADSGQFKTFFIVLNGLSKIFSSNYINMLLIARDASKHQSPKDIIFEKGDTDLCKYIISTRWIARNIKPSSDCV